MGDLLYLTPQLFKEFLEGIKTLKLKKMTHEQCQLMFEVLLSGAFRISEVLELTPKDLLPNGKIRIRNAKGGWKRCSCSKWVFKPQRLVSSNPNCTRCKGTGKYRIDQFGWVKQDIFSRLQDLAQRKQPEDKLFPIKRRQAWNYANDLLQARTHTFRHTWLTWLLETDKFDIRDIKQKARHTNVQTTIEYIEKNPDLTMKKEEDAMPY